MSDVEYLKDVIFNLRQQRDRLEKENTDLELKVSSLEFKIRHELEPRIAAEGRSYDRMILDPER
ncbi:MAG: hypothetical protein HLX51_11825 [Micrococcaceae bacterium]|nr:hypothetical protein [Micrococcaceae bacterium]